MKQLMIKLKMLINYQKIKKNSNYLFVKEYLDNLQENKNYFKIFKDNIQLKQKLMLFYIIQTQINE